MIWHSWAAVSFWKLCFPVVFSDGFFTCNFFPMQNLRCNWITQYCNKVWVLVQPRVDEKKERRWNKEGLLKRPTTTVGGGLVLKGMAPLFCFNLFLQMFFEQPTDKLSAIVQLHPLTPFTKVHNCDCCIFPNLYTCASNVTKQMQLWLRIGA